jgi:hypothetical protein
VHNPIHATEQCIATIAALAPMRIGLTAIRCLTILRSKATTWSRRSGTGCERCWRTAITHLQRGIGRLIDSYAEGVIEPGEFQPRIACLKARKAQG